MSEHTPTPWQLIWHGTEAPYPLSIHAETGASWITRDGEVSSRANASFIVTAVNRHDDLVAALEYLSDESRYDVTVTRIAKAALLSATEKSTWMNE